MRGVALSCQGRGGASQGGMGVTLARVGPVFSAASTPYAPLALRASIRESLHPYPRKFLQYKA